MNKKEKLNDTPWQFEPGDVVYIAGHTQQLLSRSPVVA